jgi:SAM-dependent methyltransferase
VPDTQRIAECRQAVANHPFWYHTLDLGDGVVTPGFFDLRHVMAAIPFFPDVAGKRCLDVGTYDGWFAFEMERRGASEVVATDIEAHDQWDWPVNVRPPVTGAGAMPLFQGAKGDGFRLAAKLLDSSVDWRPISIYDLDPAEVGRFDVVVCGSLLRHLRDPLGALEAVRRVTAGVFISAEEIEVMLSVLGRHRPLVRLAGTDPSCQWWNPNAAAHRQMLEAAGFVVEQASKPYVVRFNQHPRRRPGVRAAVERVLRQSLTGDSHPGLVHRALLARAAA